MAVLLRAASVADTCYLLALGSSGCSPFRQRVAPVDSLAEARVEGDATRRSTALDAAIPVISVAELRGAVVAAAQPPKARAAAATISS
jgi:hypothetical protein